MRWWPRREACRAVAGGELCQAAAWSGLICVACGMRETESGLRSWCTDEARALCGADASVVVGLGLVRGHRHGALVGTVPIKRLSEPESCLSQYTCTSILDFTHAVMHVWS